MVVNLDLPNPNFWDETFFVQVPSRRNVDALCVGIDTIRMVRQDYRIDYVLSYLSVAIWQGTSQEDGTLYQAWRWYYGNRSFR